MPVFAQIFLFEEYHCLRDMREPLLVLDLGANVGFSAAYFLSVFPQARVVAVEPDEENVAMCRANLAPYGNRALVVHGAVWSKRTELYLTRGDGREWSFQVGERPAGDITAAQVEAWDVGSLIDETGIEGVDLLKVDIERGELAVFGESAESWIPRVKNICIELHGEDCERAFFQALQGYDNELDYSGELTVCRNLRPKQTLSSDSCATPAESTASRAL
jgi:FkbM family methyltransferase